MKKTVLPLILLLVLAACSSEPAIKEDSLAALALEPALYEAPKTTPAAQPKVSLKQMIKRYQAILEVHDDPAVIARVSRRISDLEMLIAERQQFGEDSDEAESGSDSYQGIIDNYQRLLAENPEQPQNEMILYQLAKAYDYQADVDNQLQTLTRLVNEFPDSDYYLEAQFRRGDIYYSMKDYGQAQQAYAAVSATGPDSNYYLNAQYMLGWCLFKRSFYEPAAESFTQVLDNALAGQPVETLEKNQQALVKDTLRIMSVIFSYLDNGQSIASLYDNIGHRPYEAVLYEELAQLLADRQLHQNAIDTYETFIQQYPLDTKAPVFYSKIIDTLEQARYFSEIRPARDRFIQQYGLNSAYWKQADSSTRDYIRQQIRLHLDDMASFHHARGQALLKKKKQDEADTELTLAADYYQQWISFYPEDEKTPEKTFLLGEALFQMHDYLTAISWYEKSAYDYPSHEKAEESAYAAIVSYKTLLAQKAAEPNHALSEAHQQEVDTLKLAKINSQKRYVERFPDSQHTPQVHLNIAQSLFELKHYADAISACEQALAQNPQYTADDNKSLYLIQANSYFELQDYANAEINYQQTRLYEKPGSKAEKQLIESIAASIYKQAEQAVAARQMDDAITHFQRVKKVTPSASIVVTADYDAATYLLREKRWQEAVVALRQFQQDYPKHSFNEDIPGKLITAFEGMEDWVSAAGELRQIWKTDDDAEKQRQALFLAAQYYEKAGATDQALDSYRSYAHAYPQPFDLALETRYKLSEMYRQKKDAEKRAYWLKQLITSEQQQSTERSRYLAAFATKELAEKDFKYYESLTLTVPLTKSLKTKQKAFETVIAHYKKMDSYNVAEFSTYATHKVAELYKNFGQSLLNAEKPKGLSELELEQYDILLEEQAYPFEEQAIVIYETNTTRSWQGIYDEWVKKSFAALKTLMPGRYDKPEVLEVNDEKIF